MKYFTFCRAGREWNEDAFYACDDFAFVLDGASVVFDQRFSSEETDAKWYSKEWRDFLINNLNKDEDIFQILKKGIKTIKAKYKKLAGENEIIDFPSSTISLMRRKNGEVEFYVLGDSPIIVKTVHGNSFLIVDTRNNVNDEIVKTQVRNMANYDHISVREARRKYPDFLASSRLKKNTLGHYFVLSDSEKAVDFGLRFVMPENLISKILILSDGYSQVFDVVKFMTSEKLINSINTLDDAEKIYKKLRSYQDSDKGGDKFVRFKISDDATLVCLDFDKNVK